MAGKSRIDRKALARRIRKKLKGEGYINLPKVDEIERIETAVARLPMQGKSTLLERQLRATGFAFRPHPHKPTGHFIQVCVYRFIDGQVPHDEFLITVSEGAGAGDVDRARSGMGRPVPGRAVAPFAARNLTGITFAKMREVMETGYPGPWHWDPGELGVTNQ